MGTRAGLYLRISSDPDDKRTGVRRQRQDCEALCKARGWPVVDVFQDNDRSAYSGEERPEYERMLGAVAAGEIDVVVAYHHDRLWKSQTEHEFFMGLAKDVGLQCVATPGKDFDPADADDEFYSSLLTLVAKKESASIARRVKREKRGKALDGKFIGGPAGFGFQYDGNGSLEHHPENAKLVRDAARRLLAGESMSSIVSEWQRKGIKTLNEKTWRVDTLAKLMVTPRLAGLIVVDGKEITANWPGIISVEDHHRLLALFASRKREGRHGTPRTHLLSGLVKCGICIEQGRPGTMVPSVIHGLPRYRCQPAVMGGCGHTVVSAEHAERTAIDKTLAYLDSPVFARKLERALKAAAKADSDLAVTMEQLAQDRAQLIEIENAFGDGTLSKDGFRRQTARIQERIDKAQRTLNRVRPDSPAAKYAGHGEQLRVAWMTMDFSTRRELLRAVAERFTIMPATTFGPRFNPDRVVPVWR